VGDREREREREMRSLDPYTLRWRESDLKVRNRERGRVRGNEREEEGGREREMREGGRKRERERGGERCGLSIPTPSAAVRAISR
jgi:hypothetical protein